ncbi:hypothetical protein ACFE04_027423 [Oxalis oulophora]
MASSFAVRRAATYSLFSKLGLRSAPSGDHHHLSFRSIISRRFSSVPNQGKSHEYTGIYKMCDYHYETPRLLTCVGEKDDAVVLFRQVPGLKKHDIKVYLEDDNELIVEVDIKRKEKFLLSKHELDGNVLDLDNIKVRLRDGFLHIDLPKLKNNKI